MSILPAALDVARSIRRGLWVATLTVWTLIVDRERAPVAGHGGSVSALTGAIGIVAAAGLLIVAHAWIGSGDWMRSAGLSLTARPASTGGPMVPDLPRIDRALDEQLSGARSR